MRSGWRACPPWPEVAGPRMRRRFWRTPGRRSRRTFQTWPSTSCRFCGIAETFAAGTDTGSLLLSQALLAEGRSDDALQIARSPAAGGRDAAAQLLEADIHAAAGFGIGTDALALYRKLSKGSNAAQMGVAESLQALDRTAEAVVALGALARNGVGGATARLRLAAIQIDLHKLDRARELLASVKPATPEEAKWKSHVEARLLLAQDQPAPALVLFEEIPTATAGRRNTCPKACSLPPTFGALHRGQGGALWASGPRPGESSPSARGFHSGSSG